LNIYRVVISYWKNELHFMAERGVQASTPGQALDLVLQSLQIDPVQVEKFKSWTERPNSIDAFSPTAQFFKCVGASGSVRDIWFNLC
jgi:hypothetical protein